MCGCVDVWMCGCVDVWMSGFLDVTARLQQCTTAIMHFAVQSGLIDYNPAQAIAGAVATAKR